MNVLESDPGPIGPIVVLGILAIWFVVWLMRQSTTGTKQQGPEPPSGTASSAPFMGPGSDGKWVEQQAAAPARGWAAQIDARANQHAQMVCPHCQTKGSVTARRAKRRRRLSATRVITATATMGASLPLAGTSKKNVVTELSCSNCGMRWDVA